MCFQVARSKSTLRVYLNSHFKNEMVSHVKVTTLCLGGPKPNLNVSTAFLLHVSTELFGPMGKMADVRQARRGLNMSKCV